MGCKSQVFVRQERMTEGPTKITGRMTVPVFKTLKDNALKARLRQDGLGEVGPWKREDAIQRVKEYVLRVQAAFDGMKMGVWPDGQGPTKEGVARAMMQETKLTDSGKKRRSLKSCFTAAVSSSTQASD